MKKSIHIRCLQLMPFVIGLFGLLQGNSHAYNSEGYKNISVDEFIEMMSHKDFILINVHVPYEGEIPRTDLL